MEWINAAIIIFFGAIGMVLLIDAGWNFHKKSKLDGVGLGLIGVILVTLAIVIAVGVTRGTPDYEPTRDGIYEVLVVEVSPEYVAVAILKEEGKTRQGPPLYRKIPVSFFSGEKRKALAIGSVKTIRIHTIPSRRKAVLK